MNQTERRHYLLRELLKEKKEYADMEIPAEIAVETVKRYKQETGSRIKVVFNVFKDLDKEIYQELLG